MQKKLTTLVCIMFICLNVFPQTNSTNRIYEIWDDQPAPNRGKDYTLIQGGGYPADPDWEAHSYPIGNGYMGANIFGRTDVDRIQITEKTLANEGLYKLGGLTNFGEIYMEFNHSNPGNYKRTLNLNEAIHHVDYEHNGVKYSREYLANYPENIIAIRLTSNKKEKISFTLRVEIPYLRSANESNTKFGTTRAEKDLLTFSGKIKHFNLNYEGQIKVINEGGKLISENDNGAQIKVENANAVVLLIATGTNYKLSDKIFLQDIDSLKLDRKVFPHEEVSKRIQRAAEQGYNGLKKSHLQDYQNIFSRVKLELSSNVPDLPSKTLITNYKQNPRNVYLEELMFHYGRYLLIASSRKGTLPSGLQGVWSQSHVTTWTGYYWHNINVQMNYWGAFSANMRETFIPYLEYYQAYLPKAKNVASKYIEGNNPKALAKDGNNGWTIGTGATAYKIGAPGGHSGPGTGGFTTKLMWDYFEFTQDTSFLSEIGYPALLGMSKFLSKTLKPFEDGKLLVDYSASPEQRHNGTDYMTKGSTFDQGFVWETYNDLLKSARILRINNAFIDTISDQIKKLDPILIGESGQIKEYREEKKYSDIGDPKHRHVSHLCTIYPGTLINSNTPDWMKAVSTVLDFRGNNTTGWAMAHRMNIRARTKEAEKAHEVYSKFLKERTLPNLWTVHPPFQIDGNLGTMAGIAEMLIQSHEGFIELLPALPKAWETGFFDGLVARGNFELSLKWENSKITFLKVISNNGGKCSIKYKNIKAAQIKDSEGKIVSHTIKSENMIDFNTNKLGEYFIAF